MHPGRPWAGSGRTQDWPGQGLWPSPVLFRQSDSLHGPQATKTARWGDHTRGCWLQGGGSGRLPWALSHLKGSVSGIQRGPQSQRPCACHGCGWGRSPATPFPPGPAVQLSLSPTVACTPGFRLQLDDWCRLLTEEGPRCWAVGAGCAVPSSALPVLGSGPSAAHPSQADRPRQAPQLLLCRLQGRAWVMLRAQGGW